jgi:ubiquinone/menaquinone biosynthesis C-methylase UbiE
MADIYDTRYDRGRGREYYRHISAQLIAVLPPEGTLLDIGCGTGLFMELFQHNGSKVVGVDISRGMLRRAQGRCTRCDVALANAEKLPFCDESFDSVSSVLAFSYVQQPEEMLREAYRVLKPGGTISICTLGKNVFTSMVPLIYRTGEKLQVKKIGMGDFSEKYYTDGEIQNLFTTTGFENVLIRRCSFAHVQMGEAGFRLTRQLEPFVESHMPTLAYNICASGKKPKKL